jgi:hypothetical protein
MGAADIVRILAAGLREPSRKTTNRHDPSLFNRHADDARFELETAGLFADQNLQTDPEDSNSRMRAPNTNGAVAFSEACTTDAVTALRRKGWRC